MLHRKCSTGEFFKEEGEHSAYWTVEWQTKTEITTLPCLPTCDHLLKQIQE